jgi:hypothetical protein
VERRRLEEGRIDGIIWVRDGMISVLVFRQKCFQLVHCVLITAF